MIIITIPCDLCANCQGTYTISSYMTTAHGQTKKWFEYAYRLISYIYYKFNYISFANRGVIL